MLVDSNDDHESKFGKHITKRRRESVSIIAMWPRTVMALIVTALKNRNSEDRAWVD